MADQGPINEVRALLRAFAKTDVKACRVVVDGLEIFLSRDPSIHAVDMMAAPMPVVGRETKAALADLLAPHVGTLAALCAPGTAVEAGATYGRISVLDEEIELLAETNGIVATHCHAVGELVEYGQPLVTLTV